VALLIMDRGGGIPFERQPHVWSPSVRHQKPGFFDEKMGLSKMRLSENRGKPPIPMDGNIP